MNIQEQNDRKRKLCPHCNQFLAKSTFHQHRSLYFQNDEWMLTDPEISHSHQTKTVNLDDIHSNDIDNVFETSYADESDIDKDFSEDDDINPELCIEEDNLEEDFFGGEDEDNDTTSMKTVSGFIHLLFLWQAFFRISESAIESILKVIHYFLTLISSNEVIVDQFPKTLYKGKKIAMLHQDEFQKYVVCPDCAKLYTVEDSIYLDKDRKQRSKTCDYIEFPNHPQNHHRKKCGAVLLKTLVNCDGEKQTLYPKKLYCYQPIKKSLERLLTRKDIQEQLETVCKSDMNDGVYYDIYDGEVWKTFSDENGQSFFADKYNLGVMLNVDWFQPFTNSEHSIGAIYMVLLNLPREIRFKEENLFMIGTIPGPKEPALTINTYLAPLVSELLLFWNGIFVKNGLNQVFYRLALVSISSDLPAIRKCCGFLSYNAHQGCSKCMKTFERDSFGAKPDYSGYDTSNWIPRTLDQHKNAIESILNATHRTQRSAMESEHGLRYTELLRLPYFDPIRFHTVDTMHNMLLGVAKHTFKTWITIEVLDDNKIREIDKRLAEIPKLIEIGRTASSMAHYKMLKACEWKNWVFLFSLFCLKDIIPSKHFNIWQMFVRACFLVMKESCSVSDVEMGHSLLKLFCEQFTRVYGSQHCTPNMHMMLHVKESILDFGPVYSTWCFSFERYNGILGGYHINNRAVTLTLMRRFINSVRIKSQYQLLHGDLLPLESFYFQRKQVECDLTLLNKIRHDRTVMQLDSFSATYSVLSVAKMESLSSEDHNSLFKSVSTFFAREKLINIGKFVKSFTRIRFGRETIIVQKGSVQGDSTVFLKFENETNLTVGFVEKIFLVISSFETVSGLLDVEIPVLKFRILGNHPKKHWYGQNSPITIWSTSIHDVRYCTMLEIVRKCTVIKRKMNFDRVTLANGKKSKTKTCDVVYLAV